MKRDLVNKKTIIFFFISIMSMALLKSQPIKRYGLNKKYLNELEDAKIQLNENSTDDANIQNLRNALKKYLQYPRDRISDSSLLGSPQFPYEVDITIDGINGFKYGDVLLFPGVPKRYIKNTVFFITNITHTVDTAGMWTTKISAQMRAKID